MKRSGDVTAAAVILFCGSGLFLLMTVFMGLGPMLSTAPADQRQFQVVGILMGAFMYVALAGWGIATGIGILKLQPWARISVIVMSALAIFGCLCMAAGFALLPALMKSNPNAQVPPQFFAIMATVSIIVLLIPLGIAIWWLILFTRKRVALEFASRGAAAQNVAAPFAASAGQGSAFAGNAPFGGSSSAASPFANASAAPAMPAAGKPQIPLSIRIIVVFLLIGCASVVMGLPFTIRMEVPNVILGVVVHGWMSWGFLLALVLAEGIFCIAVLRRRVWALDGLIAFLLFSIVNTVMLDISPSRKAIFAGLFSNMFSKWPMPSGMDASDFANTVDKLMPISMAVGFLLSAVMLYFLFTRRKAFRAACAASRGAAS
jgi:hypothetical protein